MGWVFRLWPGFLIGVCLWFFGLVIISLLGAFLPPFRPIAEVLYFGSIVPGYIIMRILCLFPACRDGDLVFLGTWLMSAGFWGVLGAIIWHVYVR